MWRRIFGSRPTKSPKPPVPSDSHESWYVPNEGDESRFLAADGRVQLHLVPYRDGKGEDVLRLCEDNTGLLIGPNDPRLPRVGILVSQLRGESYRSQSGTAGDFTPGVRVLLVPEPDNPADDRA